MRETERLQDNDAHAVASPAAPWGATVESERMEQLRAAVAQRGQAAADDFWASLSEAPLCVPDPKVPGAWLVTFLWRGDPALTSHVNLCGGLVFSEATGRPLDRIDGSDVWHVTLRLPARTRTAYCFSANGPLEAPADFSELPRHLAMWLRDPLNAKSVVIPPNELVPELTPLICSVLEVPDAPPQSWVEQRGAPAGETRQHRLASAHLDGERRIWTYIPAGRVAAERSYPLIVAFDGWRAVNTTQLPLVLDNLIADGAIPPCVAVMVDAGTIEMRFRDYADYDPFVSFLAEELLPWAARELDVTPVRERTLVTGVSLGGRMAVYAGLRRPDLFGKILGQATAVTPDSMGASPAVGADVPRSAFYLDIGLLEVDPTGSKAFLEGNRKLAVELRDAGYEVQLVELACGHDEVVVRESIADGLQRLLSDTSQ